MDKSLLLLKTHVDAYTRKDGFFVAAHEDKRPARRPKVDGSTSSMADAIAHEAGQMGFHVRQDRSQQSSSHYVTVSHGTDESPQFFKVRVSNHKLPSAHKQDMGQADVEISPAGQEHGDTHSTDWRHAIHKLSEKTGVPVSKKFAGEDKASATRAASTQAKAEQKAKDIQSGHIEHLRALADDDAVTLKRSGSKLSGWLEKDGQRMGPHALFHGENGKVPADKKQAIENAIRRMSGSNMQKSFGHVVLFFKSMVAGYHRADGTYVKPHSRKGSAHVEAGSGQLGLFDAKHESAESAKVEQPKGRDRIKDYRDAVTSEKAGPTEEEAADPRRKYYVTMARDGRGVAKLAGPFDKHEDALAHVDRAREKAEELDPRSTFDSFGTAAVTSDNHKPGVLNQHLGIGAPAASAPMTVATHGDADIGRHIKIAADSVGKLRRSDVMRVLESSGSQRRELAQYIATQRPDLIDEVDEVMRDELGIADWRS